MSGYNIRSSAFRVAGITRDVYIGDIPNTNRENGSLFLFTLDNPASRNPTIVRRNVGRIDYIKGIIRLNPINIQSTQKVIDGQSVIQVVATPQSNDVIGLQDLYLQLDVNNSVFEVITDSIASGLIHRHHLTQSLQVTIITEVYLQNHKMTQTRVPFKYIVKNQLPDYVRDEFPLLGEFLSQYYLAQEFQGRPS